MVPIVKTGYQAFHSGAALLDLSDRGRIVATGEDRARLIHALTTNHVQQLQVRQFCYAFFLNAQGRIIADAYIHFTEEGLWIDTEPETRETLLRHIEHYIIADDVTLEDATERTFCVSVEGPDAMAMLAKIEAALPEQSVIAKVSFTGAPGFRVIGTRGAYKDLVRQLVGFGAVPASYEVANVVRVEHFKPRYGDDIGPTTLAQETGREDALHFKKGCYLGQEIVERIRSRTQISRVLAGMEIAGHTVFEKGQELLRNDMKAGKITSCAFSEVRGKVVAIGSVRIAWAKAGTLLNTGNALVTIVAP